MSQLVMEAFPSYGDIAQREGRYLRFMVHLCLKQGATDLEELLAIAYGGKKAREATASRLFCTCSKCRKVSYIE